MRKLLTKLAAAATKLEAAVYGISAETHCVICVLVVVILGILFVAAQ